MTSFQVYAEPNYNFDAIKDADSETQKKINSQINYHLSINVIV